MDEHRISRALGLSYFYLRFRPRTEHEMRAYLQKKRASAHFTDEEIDAVIEKLTSDRLIDDSAFVSWFVEVKYNSRQQAEPILRRRLQVAGVPRELIDRYFQHKDRNEHEIGKSALEKRWGRWVNLPALERRRKASDFLLRRGFSYSIVQKTIAELEGRE
jgi:regulatory protein